MSTLGYFFILGAFVIMRQVYKGRMANIGEDLSDAFLAIVSGDSSKFTEVFARTGDSNAPTVSTTGPEDAGNTQVKNPKTLLEAAVKLGHNAKGYRFGATGPDYYDCSGLVYRAAQAIGYKGARFVTSTVSTVSGFKPVTAPNSSGNDIVLWPAHHMGIVSGPDQCYNALNPQAGIGYISISAIIQSNKWGRPVYYRYTP
jgi:cell wall-associated NlpC family hydrolase